MPYILPTLSKKIVLIMLFDVNIHTLNLSLSINLIIDKNEFR